MHSTEQQPKMMADRYKDLPREIIELLEYDTIEVVTEELAKEFVLRDEQKEILQMEIELVLYLFFTREGLAERLQESLEIEIELAKEIVQRLDSDLFLIVSPILDLADKERLTNEDLNADVPETSKINNEEVTETTAEKPTVKPIRTLPQDVDYSRAHSYGSFRSGENKPEESGGEPIHRSNQDDIIKP